jgi:hypothetical protein
MCRSTLNGPEGVLPVPVVSPVRPGEIGEHARAVPLNVFGLHPKDGVEVRAVHGFIEPLQRAHVSVHEHKTPTNPSP